MGWAKLLLLGFRGVYPELVEGSHSCTAGNSIVLLKISCSFVGRLSHLPSLHSNNEINYIKPRNMSSLLAGAFGERKPGIVLSVRLGLFKNSIGHSVNLCSFT